MRCFLVQCFYLAKSQFKSLCHMYCVQYSMFVTKTRHKSPSCKSSNSTINDHIYSSKLITSKDTQSFQTRATVMRQTELEPLSLAKSNDVKCIVLSYLSGILCKATNGIGKVPNIIAEWVYFSLLGTVTNTSHGFGKWLKKNPHLHQDNDNAKLSLMEWAEKLHS